MSERRVILIGAGTVTARLAIALALKNIEAQVLTADDSPPSPKSHNPFENPPTLGLRGIYESSEIHPVRRERNKAQWKQELHGRKKP